jgi:cytochrome c peroxidase
MRHLAILIKLTIIILFVLGGMLVCAASNGAGEVSFRQKLKPVAVPQIYIPKGIPADLWTKHIPANNPLTPQKVLLGKALYFDKRLSADMTVSCAVCHDPASAFADHNPLALGVGGKRGTRNAPTMLNAMFSGALFWDGRAHSLEEQAKQPLVNPNEMGMQTLAAVVERVAAIPEYQEGFRRIFKREGITVETIVKALAAYERVQLSGNSPFDRFLGGDKNALTETQQRGWELFKGKAQCINCHQFNSSSPFFSDFKFHNTGIANRDRDFDSLARRALRLSPLPARADLSGGVLAHTEGISELGRFLVTQQSQDIGAFKTPTLRDIELTTPYMHDGSEKTLFDVVKFYNRGGEKNAYLDQRMRPLGLTDDEMNCLVEFMRALTSDDVLRQAQSIAPQTRTRPG